MLQSVTAWLLKPSHIMFLAGKWQKKQGLTFLVLG